MLFHAAPRWSLHINKCIWCLEEKSQKSQFIWPQTPFHGTTFLLQNITIFLQRFYYIYNWFFGKGGFQGLAVNYCYYSKETSVFTTSLSVLRQIWPQAFFSCGNLVFHTDAAFCENFLKLFLQNKQTVWPQMCHLSASKFSNISELFVISFF